MIRSQCFNRSTEIGGIISTLFLFSVFTSDGSAEASSDYVGDNTFVTVPMGETCESVTIQIQSDAIFEGTEEFQFQLSLIGMEGTYIIDGHGSATITIIDDEGKY